MAQQGSESSTPRIPNGIVTDQGIEDSDTAAAASMLMVELLKILFVSTLRPDIAAWHGWELT